MTPCFEVVDCVDQTITYTNSDLTSYIGQVISWNDGAEDRCGTVTKKYPCIENPQPVTEIVVLDCFFNCEDCLPQPEPPVPGFELKSRIVKPGYDTPACTPQYFDRVKCRWSEAVYQYMASKRYGIEFCCETDLQKWEIKNEILDIEVTKDPDIECPTVCPTVEPVPPPACDTHVVITNAKIQDITYTPCGETEEVTISLVKLNTVICVEPGTEITGTAATTIVGQNCENLSCISWTVTSNDINQQITYIPCGDTNPVTLLNVAFGTVICADINTAPTGNADLSTIGETCE